jgi:hypothetical protein
MMSTQLPEPAGLHNLLELLLSTQSVWAGATINYFAQVANMQDESRRSRRSADRPERR